MYSSLIQTHFVTATSAAIHHVTLRSMGGDMVVAHNATTALFCMLFVALGITNQPTLLAKSMVGYLLSDSASMLSGKVAFSWQQSVHHAAAGLLLCVSLNSDGLYDDITIVLGGYGEASTIPFCLCDVFRHRPSLRKVYPRLNQATRYLFGLLFLALRVVYWSAWILPCDGPHLPLCGLYALLGLQYMWGAQIVKKLIRPFL